ncbi:MAG: GGDEF domain-containing protein [Planctomycetales bacterium]
MLLNWRRQNSKSAALLLVRVDKFEGLRERYGITDSQRLIKRLSAVLCRSVRDQDLVCRGSADTFAIYMPGLDREAAEKFSVTLRNTVSHSRFH